jgi:hypothetical protein
MSSANGHAPTPEVDEPREGQTWQPPEIAETVIDAAKNANSALNGVADAIGLTEKVEKAPYAMIAAALGAGYVVGGGLFTPTTARLLRLGMKLTSIPAVRDRLLDVAEAAIDGVLANAAKQSDDPSK